MFERSLLPPNYPRYGRAVDEAGARLAEIPVPIADLWNPWTCPEVALPFLAWGMSVDIWDDAWTVTRKRAVVAASVDLHRHKGTLGGIKDHVALRDSTVVAATTPPATSFCSPAVTDVERRAYLDDLPQLRLYDKWTGDDASTATFWDDFSGRFFDDLAGPFLFEQPSILTDRAGERAIMWDRGVVTELTENAVAIDGSHYEVMLPGDGSDAVFSGDHLNDDFYLMPSTAADRLYVFDLAASTGTDRILHSFAIYPNGSAVNTEPDFVAELGTDLAGVYCGQPIGEAGSPGEMWFTPSTAGERLYRVVYFYEEGRASVDDRGLSFMGDARFGIGNYTAELSIVIPGNRLPWIADDFVGGYFYDDRPAGLDKTLDAIVVAKAERDLVFVKTDIFKPLTVGQRLLVGTPLFLGTFSSTWR